MFWAVKNVRFVVDLNVRFATLALTTLGKRPSYDFYEADLRRQP